MTRNEALRTVIRALQVPISGNATIAGRITEQLLTTLEALGLIKFDETPLPAMIDCNCNAADICPQGRTGQHGRCRIPAFNATVSAGSSILVPARYP